MKRSWKIFSAICGAFVALTAVAAASAKGAAGQTNIVPRTVLGAVHADVTTIDTKGQTRKYSWDKGRVTAKSDTSITIARRDGKSVALGLDSRTLVRAKNGTLRIGDLAIAYSRQGVAYLVLAFQTREWPPPPPRVTDPWERKTKRDVPVRDKVYRLSRRYVHIDWALVMPDGKSLMLAYDRGVITAQSVSSITLKRPDGKSVTLKTDARTRIKEDGVKIGDRVIAFSRDGTIQYVVSDEETRD